jgi:hypothetical protein
MKVVLLKNTPFTPWSAEMRLAGYEGHRWTPYTWRELPESLVRDMAKAGMPLSISVDDMPESGRVGPDSAPQLVNEDELFARLQKQYAHEEKILVAWKSKSIFSGGGRAVELDAAGYSQTWQPSEVREIPVSLYRLLSANEPENFTTKPEEIAEYLTMNQRRFSEPERQKREQREADREIKRAEQLRQYGEMQTVTIARDKLQKLGKFSDAELAALLDG